MSVAFKSRPPTRPDPRLEGKTEADYPLVIISDDADPSRYVVVSEADYRADPLTYAAQLKDVADARREALAKLAEIRWEKTCVITYGKLVIRSNKDAAQTLTHIGGLIANKIQSRETRRALGQTPPARIKFKIQDGLFLQTTEAELRDLGLALEDYVQACFDHEERLTAQILAASTSRQVMGIDLTQGWP